MNRHSLLLVAMIVLVASAKAQPEFYADPYVGLPEFRLLPLRWATAHPDTVLIEVHVRVVYDDLQFIKMNDHYEAGYSLDLFLDRSTHERVGAKHLERTVSVNDYAQTNSRLLNDHTVVSFTGVPSPYHLRVALTDKESRKERRLEKEISFPEKEWSPTLRLSDLAPLDSSGSVQMNMAIIAGQPLRAAFNLYSNAAEPPQVEYLIQNDKEEITASGKINLTAGLQFYADTLTIPSAAFTEFSHRLILKAKVNGIDLGRAFTVQAISENLPNYIQNLDLAVRQLKYLADPQEIERMQSAPQWRREEMFVEFWKRKDPIPTTAHNEKMDEYYRRVGYANEHFKGLRDGWETDRGRIYIIFGAPTEVDRHPFDIDKKPHEIWYYHDLGRRFLFVDEDGFGEYRLKSPLLPGY